MDESLRQKSLEEFSILKGASPFIDPVIGSLIGLLGKLLRAHPINSPDPVLLLEFVCCTEKLFLAAFCSALIFALFLSVNMLYIVKRSDPVVSVI